VTDPSAAPAEAERQCSAKGCRAPARWALRWNNPKIHEPERRKIWLACDDHRAYLADFLGRRDFLRDVVPLTELD
jgi:hypothetical protein